MVRATCGTSHRGPVHFADTSDCLKNSSASWIELPDRSCDDSCGRLLAMINSQQLIEGTCWVATPYTSKVCMTAVVRVRKASARSRRPLVSEVGRLTDFLVRSSSCDRLDMRAAWVGVRAAENDFGRIVVWRALLGRWLLGTGRWHRRRTLCLSTTNGRLLLLLKFELGAGAALARSFLQHARLERCRRRVLPRSVRKTASHRGWRRSRVATLQKLDADAEK